MFIVRRSSKNPILAPAPGRPWEAVAAFNPAPIIKDGSAHVFYRALARPDVLLTPYAGRSTVGYASTLADGTFGNHRQVIMPTEAWEHYGCEDPRATFFEGKWYVFYTALGGYPFSASNIRVAVAAGVSPTDLTEKHLVTPFNAKAAALFPERIGGKVALLLTAHTDEPPSTIAIALADSVEDFWTPAFWDGWHGDLASHKVNIPLRSDRDHLEVGSVPLKTEAGWLLAYSYIQHYFGDGERVFGIEAVLLDSDDPRTVVGATKFPILTPEASYERFGMVPDIVFPTGLVRRGDTLDIYYGAADTTSAIAHVSLPHLLSAMSEPVRDSFMTRSPENPILTPDPTHPWESKAVLNAAALDEGGSVHLLYRAQGTDNTSVIGYARLEDGLHVSERLPTPVYAPRQPYEGKRGSTDGNSGCEDPRAVVLDDTVYMCYTAYDGVHETRGALSGIPLDDFLAHRFDTWSTPTLLTPEGVNDKDVCLFPERIGGEVAIVHRIDPNICLDLSEQLPPTHEVNRCIELMGRRPGMWDATKVGIAGPPHKLPEGWLFIYHAVGADHVYRIGAALLNADATVVIARTSAPILEPVVGWEKEGVIGNVVFSCGHIIRDDTLYLYYGGADTALGVATLSVSELMTRLLPTL
jgi:predicted GH43/DUF377 family glycosyl hydrolase